MKACTLRSLTRPVVDRAEKKATVRTDRPASDIDEVDISVNGLLHRPHQERP